LKKYWSNLYYLNYDVSEDKTIFIKKQWDRSVDIVVVDEVHKYKEWKTLIKGVYDTEGVSPHILVTGSARLDLIHKSGESLAGRFYQHRLYPFSVAELKTIMSPQEAFDKLLRFGGFPEPF